MGQFLVQEERKGAGVQHTQLFPGMGAWGEGGHCAQEVRGPLLFSQNLGTAGRPGAGAGQGVSGAEPSASLMPV